MNKLEQIINELKHVIENSETGHLHLKERISLMKTVGNPLIINKILFECVKKVYFIWDRDYPSNEIMIRLLLRTYSYLYNNEGNKKEFVEFIDKYTNYFESIDNISSLVGLAEISLCNNIACDATPILNIDEYNGKDNDDAFDRESWSPDFYASMAYSGGNPFIKEGRISKRKEFWMWYLDTILKLFIHPNIPINPLNITKDLSIQKEVSELIRTQTYEIGLILSKINNIIDVCVEDIANQYGNVSWNKIVLEACCIKTANSTLIYFYDENNVKNKIEMKRYTSADSPPLIMNLIKREMYQQVPKEGGWLVCNMIIQSDKSYSILFNYDRYDNFPDRIKSAEELIVEFNTFPRSKEFTPDWWQNILGKKAKYLK